MEQDKMKKRYRNLLFGGLGVLSCAVIFYILALRGIGIPCLFRKLTGWLCPGCGNSRAVLALLRLDLAGALRCNLLFPLEFLYLGWVIFWCCKRYLQGKKFSYWPPVPWLDAGILAAVLLWWILRNLWGM